MFFPYTADYCVALPSIGLRPVSICLSVCPGPTIFSKLECRRNVSLSGDMTLDMNNWRSKFEVKGLTHFE